MTEVRHVYRWCLICRQMTKRIVGAGDGGPCPDCHRPAPAAPSPQMKMFGSEGQDHEEKRGNEQ